MQHLFKIQRVIVLKYQNQDFCSDQNICDLFCYNRAALGHTVYGINNQCIFFSLKCNMYSRMGSGKIFSPLMTLFCLFSPHSGAHYQLSAHFGPLDHPCLQSQWPEQQLSLHGWIP